MRTNLLRAVMCLCLGVVLVATGFVLAAIATNTPQFSDLNEFTWDAVGAAMSFLGAVATVLAILAALRIANSQDRKRDEERGESTELFCQLVLNELMELCTRVQQLRRGLRALRTIDDKTILESNWRRIVEQFPTVSMPVTAALHDKILSLRAVEAMAIAECFATAQQNQRLVTQMNKEAKDTAGFYKSALDHVWVLAINQQTLANEALATAWRAAKGCEPPNDPALALEQVERERVDDFVRERAASLGIG
jgi:hypothetical protein